MPPKLNTRNQVSQVRESMPQATQDERTSRSLANMRYFSEQGNGMIQRTESASMLKIVSLDSGL